MLPPLTKRTSAHQELLVPGATWEHLVLRYLVDPGATCEYLLLPWGIWCYPRIPGALSFGKTLCGKSCLALIIIHSCHHPIVYVDRHQFMRWDKSLQKSKVQVQLVSLWHVEAPVVVIVALHCISKLQFASSIIFVIFVSNTLNIDLNTRRAQMQRVN